MKGPMVLAAERQGLTTSDPRYWALVAPPIPWSEADEELVGGNDDAWLATFNVARVELGLRPLSPHGRPRCDLHNNLYGETYCERPHDPCPFGMPKRPRVAHRLLHLVPHYALAFLLALAGFGLDGTLHVAAFLGLFGALGATYAIWRTVA